jgi:hypothetical protein
MLQVVSNSDVFAHRVRRLALYLNIRYVVFIIAQEIHSKLIEPDYVE